MAIKCEAWRASTDNTLHASEREATEYDLLSLAGRLCVCRHPNNPLAEKLAANADEAVRLLQAWLKAHPGEGGGKVPPEGQKGPAGHAKPSPDTPMACCGKTFSACECDDPEIEGGAEGPAIGLARQFNDHG